ncbi:MAG: ClpXP protease specificity-enhancing factor SspB [Pseudomonadota bacterium]
MTEAGPINYGRVMERAMRGVMADVLGHVAEHGLTDGHHFYITFETQHPGVDMPGYLKERYPREMMIVLQEWYEDLAVMGDRFRVTLNFSNEPETLVVPFDSVKTFIDPSVKFGLKFDDQDESGDGEESEDGPEPDGPSTPPPAAAPGTSADIVSLDRFRKT